MEKTEGNNNEAQIQMQHQFNDKTSRNILQITRNIQFYIGERSHLTHSNRNQESAFPSILNKEKKNQKQKTKPNIPNFSDHLKVKHHAK